MSTIKPGNPFAEAMRKRYGGSNHSHTNRKRDINKGSSRKVKHKKSREW